MYGVKITAQSNKYGQRDKFILNTGLRDNLFSMTPSEVKPTIDVGWRDKIGAEEGFLYI